MSACKDNALSALEYSDIFLAIPTYNRVETVALTSRSLCYAKNIEKIEILVADDASTDYDIQNLRPFFPGHTQILRHPVNSGRADFAAHFLMKKFVEDSQKDVLIILDSDLLVAQDFIGRILESFPKTNGVLSLFNAHSHPYLRKHVDDASLLIKRSIGFAGSVWSRELVTAILRDVPASDRYDWDISSYLTKAECPIFCLADSAVQHLGESGQNSTILNGDYGLGFTDTNWYNLSAIQEFTLLGLRGEVSELKKEVMALQQSVHKIQNSRWRKWLRKFRKNRQ